MHESCKFRHSRIHDPEAANISRSTAYGIFCTIPVGGGSCPIGGGSGMAGAGGIAGFAMKVAVLIGPEVSKIFSHIWNQSYIIMCPVQWPSLYFFHVPRWGETPRSTYTSSSIR